MDERFLKIVDNLLITEGGFVDDPRDPGGETRFEISRRSYPALDIKNLTRDAAIEIYYQDFWTMYSYDKIKDDRIAEKVFSLCVNMGPSAANNILQIAVNEAYLQMKRQGWEGFASIHVDGIIGPETLSAINQFSWPDIILDKYRVRAARYYLSLNKKQYERGWIARALA
jgi:lysozyme family protein